MSKVQQMSVITFLPFSLFVGCLVFSRGFLLNRHIIPDKASQCVKPVSITANVDFNNHPLFIHPVHLEEETQNSTYHHSSNGHHHGQVIDITRTNPSSIINHHHHPPAPPPSPLNERSLDSYLHWCDPLPKFPKIILLLVDALKFDFVKRMPYLSSIIERGHHYHYGGSDIDGKSQVINSCLYKFMADPPTTTMQRLKALTTGTMPTFIDASANFNSYEIEEDSLIYQFYAAGKRIAFLGDDTWLSLFPAKYFASDFVEAHPSFNAWDLDTVDLAVNDSIRRILSTKHENDWDVLVTHVLGVDHCGHRYGPNHPEMERKLSETDEIIQFVHETMSDDTLLVIFGDHGMTNTGDHGGDSVDESESALVLISKRINNSLFKCPKSDDGQTLEISQIDLVPTVSILGGIPIPYSSIGQLIPDVLPDDVSVEAMAANIAQINQYIIHYSGGKKSPSTSSTDGSETSDIDNDNGSNMKSLQSSLQTFYNQVEESFSTHQKYPNSTTYHEFRRSAQTYFKQVKTIAKSTWTQFDVPMMCTGIVISLLSIICLVVYICAVPIFEHTNVKYSVLSWLWPSLAHWTIMCTCILQFNSTTGLLAIIISTLTGLVAFLTILSIKLFRAIRSIHSIKNGLLLQEQQNLHPNQQQFSTTTTTTTGIPVTNKVSKKKLAPCYSFQSNNKTLKNYPFKIETAEIIAILLYIFTCLGVFSNSFVINEGYVLGSVLLATVFLHLLCSRSSLVTLGIPVNGDVEDNKYIVKLPIVKKHFKCCWSSFAFLAIFVRMGHVFFRCREELTDCQEEFLLHKQLSSLPADWVVHKFIRYGFELVSLAVFVVIFRHWLMYRQISASRPSAVVAKYIPTVLVVLNCAFRALQGLPFAASSSSKHIRPFFEYLPRVFHLVISCSMIVVILKPLCCIGRVRPFSFQQRLPNHCNNEGQQQQQQQNPISTRNNSKPSNKSTLLSEAKANGMAYALCNSTTNTTSNTTSTSFKQSPSENGKLNDILNNSASTTENCRVNEIETSSSLSSSTAPFNGDDNLCEDVFTSILLTLVTLLTFLMVHVTSEGMSPSIPMIVYASVCLVGIYRSTPNHNFNSWSAVIAWTLASQYFFYATGHQPVFSTLPWDSAFVASSNGSSLGTSPESIMSWIPPALAVLGNLHVSQILFAIMLPLLTYWKADMEKPETLMGRIERRNAFIVCGKFIALHGLKLLFCMICAGWQRRHLMVWKIFAPKLIFEAVSFIVTSGAIIFTLIFLTRIDFIFQRYLLQERKKEKDIV